jgi:subfamily B ATP-binding cassette protein MsbA
MKRIFKEHARPYVSILIGGVICMLIVAITTATLARQMESIVDDVFVQRDSNRLLWAAVQIFVIFLLKGFSTYGQSFAMGYVGHRMIADIQKRVFNHLLKLDLGFFHNTPTGQLVSRLTTDVRMLNSVMTRSITCIGKDFFTLIFLIGLMFYQDCFLAIIAFIIFPVAIFPIIKIGRWMRKASGNVQQETAEFMTLITQAFQGMRMIKAYKMERYESTRAITLIERLFKFNIKATRVSSISHPVMEILGGTAIAAIILYGGSKVIQGTQTPGVFFSFITALLMSYEPMKHLARLNTNLQESLGAASRVFGVLDLEPLIIEHPKAKDLFIQNGDIKFHEVTFSYDQKKKVLNNLTLDIPSGKTIALVGSSGSGKSTILNLIPRFYDCQAGGITIDGKDIRDITLSSLRGNISIVSQEITLFDDTVRENISYGNLNASLQQIIKASKAAAAHDFIVNLPLGYDTVVGEQGIKLSGGQRQRLAIARAILKDALILLLDEATSALDSDSEQQVQEALNVLMQGRTTLIIAHRLSTVQDADIICVVEDGQVVATGKHEELLNENTRYARLCKIKFTRKKKTA